MKPIMTYQVRWQDDEGHHCHTIRAESHAEARRAVLFEHGRGIARDVQSHVIHREFGLQEAS